jgi:predicted nucleotidyltransferase
VEAAWDEVNALVEQFRAEDSELSRVVLFGSLARDEVLREDFDIDLAVESDRYFELLGIALRSRYHVDLVDLNTAAPPTVHFLRSWNTSYGPWRANREVSIGRCSIA